MSGQLDWLDRAEALRRNTDPSPSHAAARKVVDIGLARRHREQVLELIRLHPARDCSGLVEMARHHGLEHLDRAAISKRLTELYRSGAIYPSETGERARRWFAR